MKETSVVRRTVAKVSRNPMLPTNPYKSVFLLCLYDATYQNENQRYSNIPLIHPSIDLPIPQTFTEYELPGAVVHSGDKIGSKVGLYVDPNGVNDFKYLDS